MPVLDFHVHVGTGHHWTPWVIDYFRAANPDYIQTFLHEISPEGFLSYLDREGIHSAVILAEYAPQTTGVVTNEFVVDFSHGTDRLIPFGSICLYEGPPPAEQAEHCLSRLGCKGLKFLPSYAHFMPDDPRLLPVYEIARDLGVPVMFHTGSSIFRGSRIRFAHPLLLDDIAEDFPELVIIMAHGGRPFWYAEAQWMLRRHRNTYIDVAGIPPRQLPKIFPKIEKFRDRFVFGSDWPGIPSLRVQIAAIRALPLEPATIEALLWENGARLLGLTP